MDLTTIEFKKELLEAANRYCKQHKLTLGSLGKRLVNDRKFFSRMEADNGGCTIDTYQRLIRLLSEEGGISSPNKSLIPHPSINDSPGGQAKVL